MPRPQRANGRPGTAVIPPGWGASHAPAAAGTMTALITLREPGGTNGPFNTTTGQYPVTPHTPYATDVPCRVQALVTAVRNVTTADDQVSVSSYLISLPYDVAGVEVGHVGTISDSGDPLLDGHEVRVDDVVRGSLRFNRDLYCTLTD